MFETFVTPIPVEMSYLLSAIFLHMNCKARVACNFNFLFKNGLLKVT